MKKLLYLTLFLGIISFVTRAYAVTPTATPTVTPSASPASSATPTSGINIINEINNLKDRIASKVAQLNLVEKKGIIGIVTDIGQTQLTLSDKDNNIRFVDVDELTKFSSPSAKNNFGISDITKGSTVGVLGRYNKDSHRTLARFVDVVVLPQTMSAVVTAIDSVNYQLTIDTPDQKGVLIDIQTLTKTSAYAKDTGIVRSGFSKIKQGERIFIVGFPALNNKNQFVPSRIIRMPDIKPNPRISQLRLQNTDVTPSTGSGVKLVPIKK